MIPHLEQQIAFLTACRDYREDRVEWREEKKSGGYGYWYLQSEDPCPFHHDFNYEFRIRPRTLVLPRAEIPDEYPDGSWSIRLSVSDAGTWHTPPIKRYRTKKDRDAVVAAMLAREEE